MSKKFIIREIKEKPLDMKFEFFRTIKTFCLIMIIFCIGFIFRKGYFDTLENSRFMKFYPTSTVFYQDFTNIGEFKEFKLPKDYQSISYGIFKDDRGKDKFLMVAKTPDSDTPIIDTKEYSLFTKDGYTFLSNSELELKNLKKRIETKNYEFIKDKNIKKLIKNLDKNRDYTIVITNIEYIGLPIDEDIKKIFDKVFDKTIIQIFNRNNGIEISGEITFKNNIIDIAATAKQITENFTNRNIKIDNFNTTNLALVMGVKDFDLWTKTFLQITKTLQDNQYSETFNLIQNDFNTNFEEDIAQKLDGNAVLYLFNDKKTLHPMIVLQTKKDIVKQAQKYLSFLQLQNISELKEKEVNNRTFNVLSSGFYPYNLSFTTLDTNLFILGHQNIIESYINDENKNSAAKKCDFYLFANISKTPILNKNKGFWSNYKTMEFELHLSPSINFVGKLTR